MAILKRGMAGEPIRRLQVRLGVDADGAFGPATEKALKDYQKDNGLDVDGMAGPDTFAHMGLHELILLRKGSKGTTVKRLQEALGIGADGIYGSGTAKAVKAFQSENGLAADGMAGPATLAKIDLFDEFNEETVSKSYMPADKAEWDKNIEVPEEHAPEMAKADAGGFSIWKTVKGFFN